MHIIWFTTAYGRTIAIDTENADLALPFLPFPWGTESPIESVDRTYRVRSNPDGVFDLSIDDQPHARQSNLETLGDLIEGDLHHWLATYTRGFLFVHAGCVGWRDRAIVLPGRSHAGKTTLTRALVEAGATYYSDDYAIVDTEGMIWPFARRLSVRPTTPAPSHKLDPVTSNWPIGRVPLRAVLIAELQFDREKGWQVEHTTHGLGIISLLNNTVAARERPEDSLSTMSNVLVDAFAIQGTRGDAESTTIRLLQMVDEFLGISADPR